MAMVVCLLIVVLSAFGGDLMMVTGKVERVEGNILYVKPSWCSDRELLLEVEEPVPSVKPGDEVSFVTKANPCFTNRVKVKGVFPGGKR